MKKTFRALLVSVAASLMLVVSSSSWAAYVLSVNPLAPVGHTVDVNIDLSLDAGEFIDSIGFSLAFDTAHLSFVSGKRGSLTNDFLIPWFTFSAAEGSAGVVNVSTTDLPGNAPLSTLNESIAVLSFMLQAPGTSDLTLSSIVLAGPDPFDPDFPFGLTPLILQGSAFDSAITVQASNQTPAPGTLLLLGLGLALLGWTRRPSAMRTSA